MSEAPERVWLQLGAGEYGTHTWCDQPQDWADENGDGEPEYIRADLVDTLLKQAREEALREAGKNLSVYAPTLVDGPEHDVGYHHGYSTAMNRILDMLQEDFPRKAKKPSLVGTGVQMGILKKNSGS